MKDSSQKTGQDSSVAADVTDDVCAQAAELDAVDPALLFRALQRRLQAAGIPTDSLSDLKAVQHAPRHSQQRCKQALWITSAAVVILSVLLAIQWPTARHTALSLICGSEVLKEKPGLVEQNDRVVEATRPPADCGLCKGLKDVPKVANITPEEFEKMYAYSGVPVVVTDAMQNWTAPQTFSFSFFKDIYAEESPDTSGNDETCQFFPYRTKFETLQEVFEMPEERAMMTDGSEPWYIGWSNCDAAAANILREHYDRPYFLPSKSESSKTDWIFMGSPGYGAHIHVDSVGLPSWQAQVTGSKLWTLEPPTECYWQCASRIEVEVKPGEIIVLDTNQWYHGTKVTSKDISITIGSEYD